MVIFVADGRRSRVVTSRTAPNMAASRTTGCPDPELCAAEFADTPLQQGQGAGGTDYNDAASAPGRVVGLRE